MDKYGHILVAVDYSHHCRIVAEKARQLASLHQAKLSLLHVLDNIPMPQMQYGTIIPLDELSDNTLLEAEKKQADRTGQRSGYQQR